MGSTVKSVAGRSVHRCYPFLKSLRALSDVALKIPWWISNSPLPHLAPRNRDILVLKNNKGTEDNRVKLDYSIQLSELFYKRFISSGNITLFSPHDTGLRDAFGTDKFDDLYTRYESDESIPKTVVPAQDLILAMLKREQRQVVYMIILITVIHIHLSKTR